MTGFLQDAPRLPHSWDSDGTLRDALAWVLGDEAYESARGALEEMGRVAVDPTTLELAARAERETPEHVPYATWGERIDDIRVSPAWYAVGRLGIEAGVTSLPYEETSFGDAARIVGAAMLVLWGPSSALYSCPVAMTDAAARTLLEYGGADDLPVVERLTTRDFDAAWTSGQWMTETAGGSDVGRTGTVARRGEDGTWRLHGTKWFTSATTSEVALTLARPEGAPEGSRGLALFRIHRSLSDGTRNAIMVRRLKEKLGTRALPTAELELEGAIATPVGDPLEGGGVRRIATMLNITRLHNAIGSAGSLARGLAWARAYARVREVFGRSLAEMPAHRATLASLSTDYAATLALALRCAELTGKMEHHTASSGEIAVLRALTPVSKLATARWAVAGAAEAMEAVGGVGYCEDSTIPALVRNTHVQPIWEGTTNVLSLDLLRAATRSNALEALLEDASSLVGSAAGAAALDEPVAATRAAIAALRARTIEDRDEAEAGARSLALSVAQTYACALLCAEGAWGLARGNERPALFARALGGRGLVIPSPSEDRSLAFDDEVPRSTPARGPAT